MILWTVHYTIQKYRMFYDPVRGIDLVEDHNT